MVKQMIGMSPPMGGQVISLCQYPDGCICSMVTCESTAAGWFFVAMTRYSHSMEVLRF